MYHFGIGEVEAGSTITRANVNRLFQIWENLAMLLIKEAKQLHLPDDDPEVALKGNVFAIDATTICLCIAASCWANFRTTKGSIQQQTQYDQFNLPPIIMPQNIILKN